MDAGNRDGAEQFSPVQLNEKELPEIMKRAVIMSAALCLSCISAAADAPDDWTGRDGKPSNLRAGTDCLSVADPAKEFYVFSAKPLPVHPDGKYQLTGTFRRTENNKNVPRLYFGIAMYDGNGKWMNGFQSCPLEGTHTELAAPAKKGDRVLKLRDASAWKKQASAIAFGAKADFSDLPNRNISPAITHIEKSSDTWEVTLRHPLGKDHPAGTPVRQQSGPPYLYVRAGAPLDGEWKTFTSGIIGGPGLGRDRLWKGTAAVKVVIFSAGGQKAGMDLKEIVLKEIKP